MSAVNWPHGRGEKSLAWYRSLHDSRERRKAECFLVEGARAVGFIQDHRPDLVVEILELQSDDPPFTDRFPVRRLNPRQFQSIAVSQHPTGPLAIIAIPPDSFGSSIPDDPGNTVLLLEAIQDPGNVGTLVRTGAALGFSGIILSDKSADPFAPKAAQASAGSLVSPWIRRTASYLGMVRELKGAGFTCIGTDVEGSPSIAFAAFPKKIVALGNEGAGLSGPAIDLCDALYGIPIDRGKAESLNVAAAGAISMFAASHHDA